MTESYGVHDVVEADGMRWMIWAYCYAGTDKGKWACTSEEQGWECRPDRMFAPEDMTMLEPWPHRKPR